MSLQLESDLKYGLQLAIQSGIATSSPYCFDYDNICKIIAEYASEPQVMYHVVYSGGNSEWSINDINVHDFSSYDSALNFFNDNLQYIFGAFQDHYLICLERFFMDRRILRVTEPSCLDYMYLDVLFNSKFPEPCSWSGNRVTLYYKATVHFEICKSYISVSSTTHVKRPIRLDFIGAHPLWDMWRVYSAFVNVYNCKQEKRENIDGYLTEFNNKLLLIKKDNPHHTTDSEDELEDDDENMDTSNIFNIFNGNCKCEHCTQDSEQDSELEYSESESE